MHPPRRRAELTFRRFWAKLTRVPDIALISKVGSLIASDQE
jgi:hypothetical protein